VGTLLIELNEKWADEKRSFEMEEYLYHSSSPVLDSAKEAIGKDAT